MTTKKKVRYNGGIESLQGCSSPEDLSTEKVYTVISEIDLGFQTNYKLEGLSGEYNSLWFDSLYSSTPTYFALSTTMPTIGKCLVVKRFFNNNWMVVKTPAVQSIRSINGNTFQVQTNNSIYIVQIV